MSNITPDRRQSDGWKVVSRAAHRLGPTSWVRLGIVVLAGATLGGCGGRVHRPPQAPVGTALVPNGASSVVVAYLQPSRMQPAVKLSGIHVQTPSVVVSLTRLLRHPRFPSSPLSCDASTSPVAALKFTYASGVRVTVRVDCGIADGAIQGPAGRISLAQQFLDHRLGREVASVLQRRTGSRKLCHQIWRGRQIDPCRLS